MATVSVSDYRIENLDSFQDVTGESGELAGLYFFSLLDCLVVLATKVAHDFFDRPHLYTTLEPEGQSATVGSLAALLARLHARDGSTERFLSAAQRAQIYRPLFGPSPGAGQHGEHDFKSLSRELVNACAAFAERVFDSGVEMLRERVRTTHRPFKQYLTGLQGDSVQWSRNEALPQLTEEVAYAILRSHTSEPRDSLDLRHRAATELCVALPRGLQRRQARRGDFEGADAFRGYRAG